MTELFTYLLTHKCDMPTSCIMTQQNATFWVGTWRQGLQLPNSNTARFVYNAPSHQVSSSYV